MKDTVGILAEWSASFSVSQLVTDAQKHDCKLLQTCLSREHPMFEMIIC